MNFGLPYIQSVRFNKLFNYLTLEIPLFLQRSSSSNNKHRILNSILDRRQNKMLIDTDTQYFSILNYLVLLTQIYMLLFRINA